MDYFSVWFVSSNNFDSLNKKMAVTARLAGLAAKQALLQSRCVVAIQPRRNRHKAIFRGKWPEEARTFQQRLDGMITQSFLLCFEKILFCRLQMQCTFCSHFRYSSLTQIQPEIISIISQRTAALTRLKPIWKNSSIASGSWV